jgi:hypothetical protein
LFLFPRQFGERVHHLSTPSPKHSMPKSPYFLHTWCGMITWGQGLLNISANGQTITRQDLAMQRCTHVKNLRFGSKPLPCGWSRATCGASEAASVPSVIIPVSIIIQLPPF